MSNVKVKVFGDNSEKSVFDFVVARENILTIVEHAIAKGDETHLAFEDTDEPAIEDLQAELDANW